MKNGNIQSIKRYKLGTQKLNNDLTYMYDETKEIIFYQVENAVPRTMDILK